MRIPDGFGRLFQKPGSPLFFKYIVSGFYTQVRETDPNPEIARNCEKAPSFLKVTEMKDSFHGKTVYGCHKLTFLGRL
jgi:hypothetical protein